MIPNWLLPSKAPALRGNVITHRLNTQDDDRSDRHSTTLSQSYTSKIAREKKHAEWKAFHAAGWTPQEIADKYGVYASTIRRITGGSRNRNGRKGQKIQIDGVIYESQVKAMKTLHISREKLVRWIYQNKAKYV